MPATTLGSVTTEIDVYLEPFCCIGQFFPKSGENVFPFFPRISPNPTTGNTNLIIDVPDSDQMIFADVRDYFGNILEVIYNFEVMPVGTTVKQLDISNENDGIYFLRLTNLSGNTITLPLLKSH